MPANKKILFIHHGVGIGGAPKSLALLIAGLDRTLYTPVVVCLQGSAAQHLFRQAGAHVITSVGLRDFPHTVIWWHRWYHLHLLFFSLIDWLKIYWYAGDRLFDQEKPDIIHLNTSSLSAWAAVAHRRKILVIWHIRESIAPGYFGIRRALTVAAVKKWADIIIAISTHDGRFWRDDVRLHVVHNPVDLTTYVQCPERYRAARAAAGYTPATKIILYVGGLSYEKGADRALNLLANLRMYAPEHEVVLWIAGSWSTRHKQFLGRFAPQQAWYDAVEKKIDQHHASIKFLGVVTDMPALYQAADLLLFPARVGHFARPVIEAAACGVPSLASNLSPLDELIMCGKTGFLCADDQEFFDFTTKLFKQPEIMCQLGRAAQTHARHTFGADAYAQTIKKIFSDIF